jgi:hypothetical protein
MGGTAGSPSGPLATSVRIRIVRCMAWAVERTGATVRVEIGGPVEDWAPLFDDVNAALDPRPAAVALPRRVEGGSVVDARQLRMLWAMLSMRGLTIQRSAG